VAFVKGAFLVCRRAAGTPAALWVALLTWSQVLPDSNLSRVLTGRSGIEAELSQAQARGYYERLIDADVGPPGAGATDPPVGPVAAPPGVTPFAESGIIIPVPGYRRWQMLPSVDTRWNGTTFRTNRLGLRSPEVSTDKPPGTYRIVVIGSSNTMGHGVDDGDVYPRPLESWLDAAVAATGRRVEVVNLATCGAPPSLRLLQIRDDVAAFRPDWVICDASVLDVSLEEHHLEVVVRERRPIPFVYVREAVRRSGASPDDPPADIRLKLGRHYPEFLEGAYAGWADEARRLGVPFTVLLLPRADTKAGSPRMVALLKSLARRNGLDLIDAFDAFRPFPLDQIRVGPWDPHPSARGHRAIFEALRDELVRRGGPPGLPLPSARAPAAGG
jgi:hypothetical protein